ncbi:class I SAM-dependent methyltransferase [Sphingobacterium lactis]|uniref:Methyltransferase domain-containing protein n=1 Tax=Sphingobacterium lactis TaxID=797291 RepID=A0A1H5Z0P3_9SPHI|nr:methyltransferase [Sphingobacterium lactis]SEG29165.1 hypothetical protein SAMN05421877_106181 [Sphingobacterium lactis]
MEIRRKPFQGVWNIVLFNWHFYVLAGIGFIGLAIGSLYLPDQLQVPALIAIILLVLGMFFSLAISHYIYDRSTLYELHWLPDQNDRKLLNINAGLDETSAFIHSKYPSVGLTVCDFYNPQKHTEISIKRARSMYPPYQNTLSIPTDYLAFPNHTFDTIVAFLAAHEIRDERERILFFKELNRVAKANAKIYITEHLRDCPNFLAYTIGFFHFHSRATWMRTFHAAKFKVTDEIKSTPFISTFILQKNGDPL